MTKKGFYWNNTGIVATAPAGYSWNPDIANLWWDGTYYWKIFHDASPVAKIAKCTTLTGTWSVEYSVTNAGIGTCTGFLTCIKKIGSTLYFTVTFLDSTDAYHHHVSFNGAAWTEDASYSNSDTYLANDQCRADIFTIGGSIYSAYTYFSGADQFCRIHKWDNSASYNDSTAGYPILGCVYNSNYYYCAGPGGADQNTIRKFNGTVFSTVEALTLDTTSFTACTFFYWRQGNTEIVSYSQRLYYRQAQGVDWAKITVGSGDTTGVGWIVEDGELRITYIDRNGAFLHINESTVGPVTLQTITHVSGPSFNDEAGAGYIFLLTSYTLEASFADVFTLPYKGPDLALQIYTEPVTNEYLMLYDNADNLVFEGWVKEYKNEIEGFDIEEKSPIQQDLDRVITVSFTTKKVYQMIETILTTYCTFLHYHTGISHVPATTYDREFANMRIGDIFAKLDQQEWYLTSIRPDGEVYWDNGLLDSGLVITEATNFADDPEVYDLPLKLSKVTVLGGIVNGVRLEAVAYGEANYGEATFRHSEIIDQTELNTLAAALVVNTNSTITRVHITVQNITFIPIGTFVTLTLDDYGITAESYYAGSSHFDAINSDCEMYLYSAFHLPFLTDAKNADQRIVKVEERATDLEGMVAYLQAHAADYDALAHLTDVNITPADHDLLEYNDPAAKWEGKQISELGNFIDEDSMATNSAVKVCSQQSIKAYADTKLKISAPETLGGNLPMGGNTITGLAPCYVYGYNSAGTTCTNLGNVKIPFTEVHDLGSNWVTDKFTAPRDGRYQVDCVLLFDLASWAVRTAGFIRIYIDGTDALHGAHIMRTDTTTIYLGIEFHATLKLNANQYIEIYVYQNSGGNINLLNQAIWNWLTIAEVL